jgi:hypothetical protein
VSQKEVEGIEETRAKCLALGKTSLSVYTTQLSMCTLDLKLIGVYRRSLGRFVLINKRCVA